MSKVNTDYNHSKQNTFGLVKINPDGVGRFGSRNFAAFTIPTIGDILEQVHINRTIYEIADRLVFMASNRIIKTIIFENEKYQEWDTQIYLFDRPFPLCAAPFEQFTIHIFSRAPKEIVGNLYLDILYKNLTSLDERLIMCSDAIYRESTPTTFLSLDNHFISFTNISAIGETYNGKFLHPFHCIEEFSNNEDNDYTFVYRFPNKSIILSNYISIENISNVKSIELCIEDRPIYIGKWEESSTEIFETQDGFIEPFKITFGGSEADKLFKSRDLFANITINVKVKTNDDNLPTMPSLFSYIDTCL